MMLKESTVFQENIVCGSTQSIADELVERSIKNQVRYMGRNDATAIVIAVDEYPDSQ